MEYKKFLLFGDSITEFAFEPEQFTVGSALANAYTRKLDIIQRGYAGYNSRWAIPILEQILEKDGSDIVIGTIFFGSNDAVKSGPQKVRLAEYLENNRKMIQMMRNAAVLPIVLGPGVLNRELWEVLKKEDIAMGYVRTNEAFNEYSNALKDLCSTEKVPYIGLGTRFVECAKENNEDWKDYLEDGLHFSGKGYRILFEEIMKSIKVNYPQWSPENIETILPNWRDMSANGSVQN